jgi:precorrin-2 dehydrogenase/sirohydrochlorin ferrochelatase
VNYYPAFLNLHGKKAVIVGGGNVAERKVLTLVKAGAAVTVISPTLTKRLLKEKERKNIHHIARNYRQGDLRGSFLVIAATDVPSVNSRIAKEAPSLVNVVDVPKECTFIAPSVITRGPLSIAISTGGASPAFSKTIRKELEKVIGPEVGEYLKFAGAMRKKALAEISDREKRERFLKDLASEKTLQSLRTKGMQALKHAAEERLEKLRTSR